MSSKSSHEAHGQTTLAAAGLADVAWLEHLPPSEHISLFRSTDWSSTPLGPLNAWDPSLRFAVNMVFNDTRPAVVYWGPEMIAVYNERFIEIAADAHPMLMGRSFSHCFPEAVAPLKHYYEMALYPRTRHGVPGFRALDDQEERIR
ncbi:hypothetical protein MRB53_040863 [Persea americana]|nr:hypothetical protein MRB53_040863 [Persea americana]